MKVLGVVAGAVFLVAVGLYFVSETLRDIDEAISGAFYE